MWATVNLYELNRSAESTRTAATARNVSGVVALKLAGWILAELTLYVTRFIIKRCARVLLDTPETLTTSALTVSTLHGGDFECLSVFFSSKTTTEAHR